MMLDYVYFNGEILPHQDVHIGLSDLGLLRGYSIFDFFPIRGGHPIFIDDYIARFQSSAQQLALPFELSDTDILKGIYGLIQRNNMSRGYMRFLLTGGEAIDGYTPSGKSNFCIIPYEDIIYPKSIFENGVKLITVPFTRQIPLIKTTNYAVSIRERNRVLREKAFDVLYVNNGWISESSRSNFFIITQDEVIITPDRNILEGITRKRILEAAREKNYLCQLRDIHIDELRNASESFMTSSTKGALSVVRVDGITIGSGRPGRITLDLQEGYQELVKSDLEKASNRIL